MWHFLLIPLSLQCLSVSALIYDDKGIDEPYDNFLHDYEEQDRIHKFSFLMPNVSPKKPETYLCTPVKIDSSSTYHIIGYEPKATMNTAHHILLYGCKHPGLKKVVWNCGEMSGQSENEAFAGPCADESQVLYAWARDAPKFMLPAGVGFKIGADSAIKYMVLQIHYAHVDKFLEGSTDDSGVFIDYTLKPLNKLASVILLSTGGVIPPMSTTHMEVACKMDEKKTIYPIAYRTHTHTLGKVVSGYRVRADKNGLQHWTLLGKRDPMTPQMFYPIENSDAIEMGDILAARCTMESKRTRETVVGMTGEDEMCNFYLMYYVEDGEPLETKYCFTAGPPYYYWNTTEDYMDLKLNNIPDIAAGVVS